MKRTPPWVFVAAVGVQLAALGLCLWAMDLHARSEEEAPAPPSPPPPAPPPPEPEAQRDVLRRPEPEPAPAPWQPGSPRKAEPVAWQPERIARPQRAAAPPEPEPERDPGPEIVQPSQAPEPWEPRGEEPAPERVAERPRAVVRAVDSPRADASWPGPASWTEAPAGPPEAPRAARPDVRLAEPPEVRFTEPPGFYADALAPRSAPAVVRVQQPTQSAPQFGPPPPRPPEPPVGPDTVPHFITDAADETTQIVRGRSDLGRFAFGFYPDGNIRFVDFDGGRYAGKAESARARMRELDGMRAFTVQIGVAADGRLQATFTGGPHDTETIPLEPLVGWSVA